MALQATLQGATPRPNVGENYFHFCKRCINDPLTKDLSVIPKVFNHYSQMNFKSRDLQFFTEVEREIRKIVRRYYPTIEAELDEINERVFRAIQKGQSWEQLVRNEGIIDILSDVYEETGVMVNGKYASKFGGEKIEKEKLGGIMAAGLGLHLATYKNPFNEATISRIRGIEDPQEILWDNRLRALGIAGNEAGIAQSIAEEYTMMGVPVKKYWLGRLDDRIRDAHLEATYTYNESNAIGFNDFFLVRGELLKHPRDFNGSARNTVNCRCYLNYLVL
jgi:hypothetical protein